MILTKLKSLWYQHKLIESLAKENRELKSQVSELKKSVASPLKVFETLFSVAPKWYDPENLTYPERVKYYDYAQGLLNNPVFKNEVSRFIADTMYEISFVSPSIQNVENLRFSMNGVKALQERVSEIRDPQKNVADEAEDPYSGI